MRAEIQTSSELAVEIKFRKWPLIVSLILLVLAFILFHEMNLICGIWSYGHSVDVYSSFQFGRLKKD